MSTTLFYHARAALNVTVEFDSSEATHITKALRLKTGDVIELTNGMGELFRAEILIEKHRVSAAALNHLECSDSSIPLHLGIAPTKNADRIEWLVEKAIELGIGQISLLNCCHSERARISMERLNRIAIAALKQSRRTYLPIIHEVVDFEEWLSRIDSNERFIAHCMDSLPRSLLRDSLSNEVSVCIAIGPEGDFSESEIRKAQEAGFRSVSLGTARLRTETAALAAVHTYNLHHQQ